MLILLLSLCAASALAAQTPSGDHLRDDPRLQPSLTVRASRMPLEELLRRLDSALDVRLAARGDDVATQKVDLFARAPAHEMLAAVTELLNAQDPGGYRWEREGASPHYRYALTRSVASRQQEAARATEAERRLNALLRARLAALGGEPFRPDPDRPIEVPAMRALLAALSPAQVERLIAERLLVLTAATCEPGQRPLLKELIAQAVTRFGERYPDSVAERVAIHGPPDRDPNAHAEIYLEGDAPRYLIRVGAAASHLGGASDVASVIDPTVAAGEARVAPPWTAPDPKIALPPRAHWLMGDVLADLAARAGVNLIADDYTQTWEKLARLQGARPFSVWLNAIRAEYGFEVARAGNFVRLRNRRWWLDQRREIDPRWLARLQGLIRGGEADRLRAAVEVARLAPLAPNYQTLRDRLQGLALCPEVSGVPGEVGDETFTTAVARVQTELLMFDALPPALQRRATSAGLTLAWTEMPPRFRELFARRVALFVAPGLGAENLVKSRLFLQFHDDRLLVRWLLAGLAPAPEMEEGLALGLAAGPASLVGQPLPALEVTDTAGKVRSYRPVGPLLLLVAPAWPRPVVLREESFAELQALRSWADGARGPGAPAMLIGTEATAAELGRWWPERGVSNRPLALSPASAARLGMQHETLALGVDRGGRVVWAKAGFEAGDEAEWRRQWRKAANQASP